MDNSSFYQRTVEQRLRDMGYFVELNKTADQIKLNIFGYKPLTSLFDPLDFSYVFMLMHPKAEEDLFLTSEKFLHWSGTLPIPRSASLIKQRVSVSVFIAERFSEELKWRIREYECKHNKKFEFVVLAETATSQVTFNRNSAWNSVVGRKWGQWVLPNIVKTIDDLLRF